MPLPVSVARIRSAHASLQAHVRRTPLLRADPDHAHGAAELTLKLELFQHAGSFKARGAFHNLLSREVPPSGVTAASGGNHGVAVALAAARLGHAATVFVPEISAPVKIAAIRAHGARAVVGGARYADAQAACDAYARETGALLVHPFDSVATLEGTGTVALEWEEDQARLGLAPLDTVLVAVGGGGLVAGMACYWSGRVKIVAVEPAGSRCLHAALEAGRPVDVDVGSIAADSLGARRVGALAFEAAKAAGMDAVALVSDEGIRAAQRLLWTSYRIAAEPGGAAALAALVEGAYVPDRHERVGVLVCGGNVDPATLG